MNIYLCPLEMVALFIIYNNVTLKFEICCFYKSGHPEVFLVLFGSLWEVCFNAEQQIFQSVAKCWPNYSNPISFGIAQLKHLRWFFNSGIIIFVPIQHFFSFC